MAQRQRREKEKEVSTTIDEVTSRIGGIWGKEGSWPVSAFDSCVGQCLGVTVVINEGLRKFKGATPVVQLLNAQWQRMQVAPFGHFTEKAVDVITNSLEHSSDGSVRSSAQALLFLCF